MGSTPPGTSPRTAPPAVLGNGSRGLRPRVLQGPWFLPQAPDAVASRPPADKLLPFSLPPPRGLHPCPGGPENMRGSQS